VDFWPDCFISKGPELIVLKSFAMMNIPVSKFTRFSELPLESFNSLKFSVYIIDFGWNYLFVNDFVRQNLGERGENLVGKNMWKQFEQLATDPTFIRLKNNMDQRIITNIVTTSPLNFQRLNIIGYPLEDCFYFSSSILPDKGSLINEIRNELVRANSKF
jgi:hypothetical protein